MRAKTYLLAAVVLSALATAATADPVYKALLVGRQDWANDIDDMKDAMLAWDTVYWEDENIVLMKDPTGTQVLNAIAPIDTRFGRT